MKLNFIGRLDGLEAGIGIMSELLGFTCSSDGVQVNVENRPGNIEVAADNDSTFIKYDKKIHFFRALGLLIEELQGKRDFKLAEEPQFDSNGIMIDASRNGVLKVESIKRIIRIIAVMGLNTMLLYTEDTFTVETKPFFGYMRGRYTYDELKECDDYADIFGIEIIPCMQTLGHLFQALKWDYARELKDTEDVLLAGSERTYEFVEEMVKAASAPFRSKRIHIGMDEAHTLGLGRYLDMNGYRRRFDIMCDHLDRVRGVACSYGLKPMIWSDMYFRLASKTGDYYDMEAEIPEDVVKSVPKDVQLVYWDYYHNYENIYTNFIRKHMKFGCDIVFAGGIWTWNGVAVNYKKTFLTTEAGLSACKKEGIREVFAAMWGDNGTETNFFSGLLGMQLFAEHGYSKELDMDKLKRRFKFCTGEEFDDFMELTYLDDIPSDVDVDMGPSNPAKFLLWQDILIGLFDRHVEGMDLSGHYSELCRKYSSCAENNINWGFVFDMPARLANVLSLKWNMGIRLKDCYERKDLRALREIEQKNLPLLYDAVRELRDAHRKQWFSTYKPFGWEVIDIRYGGLLSRIETAAARLSDYLNGMISVIEELEEERLYFDGPDRQEGPFVGKCNVYSRIVSACPL